MEYDRVRRWSLVLVVLIGLTAIGTQTAIAHSSSTTPTVAQADLNPIPGPWEAVEDIIKEGVKDIQKAVDGLVKKFNWLMFSLPAPGDPYKPGTWADYPWKGGMLNFTDKWWNAVWRLYWGLTGVATISLSALAVYHHSNRTSITGDPIHNQERTREAIRGFISVTVGWVGLSLYLHGMNVLIVGVAPTDFTTSFGNFAKLGLGVVVGGVVLALESSVIIIAVLVLIAQWLLVIFAFATFPVAMVARVSGSNYAQVVSDTIISLLVGLPMLKFVQVLLLRFAYSLPTPAGPSSLLSIAVMTLGITIAFIYLPIRGTERLLPEAMIATGGSLRSGGNGTSDSTDSTKAEAVSAQASKVANQVRTGPESASRRSTPSESSGRRGSKIGDKRPATTQSQPVRANSGDTSRISQVSETPSVTVNTAVNSQNISNSQAEAEASATSRSEQTSRRTGRLSYRLLDKMKKRANQHRRKNKDTNDGQ